MYINHIQSNNKCNNVTIYWLALLPKNVTNLSFASERTQADERSQLRRLTAPRCSKLRLIPGAPACSFVVGFEWNTDCLSAEYTLSTQTFEACQEISRDQPSAVPYMYSVTVFRM